MKFSKRVNDVYPTRKAQIVNIECVNKRVDQLKSNESFTKATPHGRNEYANKINWNRYFDAKKTSSTPLLPNIK